MDAPDLGSEVARMRVANTVSLSGWIFADLLLALVVLFVAISAPELPSARTSTSITPSPSASRIASASPRPTRSVAPAPQDAILLRSVCKKVHVENQTSSAVDSQVLGALAASLADLGALPVRLKLVYTYGVWPLDDGTATRILARKVTDALKSEALRRELPNLLGDADQILTHDFRAIPGGSDLPGDVYIELYLAALADTNVPASGIECPR